MSEKYECPECGEIEMIAVSLNPNGSQTFECQACGYTEQFP